MTRMPDLLSTADLPLAVLCAAALDGHLFRLGEGFLPADLPETPELRARAVLLSLDPHRRWRSRLIAVGETARWVLGLRGLAPASYRLAETPGSRVPIPPGPGYTVERLSVTELAAIVDRIRLVGGLRVLSPG